MENSSRLEECGNYTEMEENMIQLSNYWLEGVFMIAGGVLGLIGNTVSILVLSSVELRNSFNYFLVVLAFVDNTFIFFTLLDYSFVRVFQWPLDMESEMYALIFPKWLYPINNISLTLSILLVMLIAHERYLAVCYPHDFRQQTQSGGGRRVAACTAIGFLLAVTINIPKFFETEVVHEMIPGAEEGQRNYTISYIVTSLRKDPDYIRYYVNWCLLLCTGIIPLVFLLYFNYRIFQGIRFTHARCRNSNSSELNLAIILICIVVVFVTCHFLRIILNCFEVFLVDIILRCGEDFNHAAWFHCLNSISHLLLVLNSSANFLIYYSMGTKFKVVLKQTVSRILRIPYTTKTTSQKKADSPERRPMLDPATVQVELRSLSPEAAGGSPTTHTAVVAVTQPAVESPTKMAVIAVTTKDRATGTAAAQVIETAF